MFGGVIERFGYRFKLWCRARRDEYFDTEMKSLWKRLILIALIFGSGLGLGIATGICYGRAAALVIDPERLKYESSTGDTLDSGYALFTWARSGKLCFAIVPRLKGGEFARNWFAKCTGECGISRLEEDLSVFPPGTDIEWRNWPDDWGGWTFGWPQDEVTDRIKNFAKAKHLNLTFCCSWLD